jgi:hypothetical protein
MINDMNDEVKKTCRFVVLVQVFFRRHCGMEREMLSTRFKKLHHEIKTFYALQFAISTSSLQRERA